MRTVDFIGVLVFLVFMVSSASAETFYLTDVNDHKYDGKLQIEISYSGNLITIRESFLLSNLPDSSFCFGFFSFFTHLFCTFFKLIPKPIFNPNSQNYSGLLS